MIRPFLVGFATTLRHFFKKPITVNYPAQKVPVFPKYRGKQVLMCDEDGLEKSVACGLCSVACPADAIYLEAAENDGSVGRWRDQVGCGARAGGGSGKPDNSSGRLAGNSGHVSPGRGSSFPG